MVEDIHSVRFISSLLIFLGLFASSAAQAEQGVASQTHIIEVFISADVPVTGEAAINRQPELKSSDLQIYKLDAIQQIETELSRDLASDPERAKSAMKERIQLLNADARAEMQNAATGMAKAMQYGIDRLPAMTIDGQAVVYGVTDLHVALGHYAAWRAGKRP